MEELIQSLKSLADGQCAACPTNCSATSFRLVVEDGRAKEAAYSLAKGMGCVIENRPHEQAVYFVKT